MSKRFSPEDSLDGCQVPKPNFDDEWENLRPENLRSLFNTNFWDFERRLRNLVAYEPRQNSNPQINTIRDSNLFITDAQGQKAGYYARIGRDWEVLNYYALEFVLQLRCGHNPANFTINSLKSVGRLNCSGGLSVSLNELSLRYSIYQPDLSLAEKGVTQKLSSKLEIYSKLISALRDSAVCRNYFCGLEAYVMQMQIFEDVSVSYKEMRRGIKDKNNLDFIDALVDNLTRNSVDDIQVSLREIVTLELGSYFLRLANESLKVLG